MRQEVGGRDRNSRTLKHSHLARILPLIQLLEILRSLLQPVLNIKPPLKFALSQPLTNLGACFRITVCVVEDYEAAEGGVLGDEGDVVLEVLWIWVV
jgi:hypothetical protein